MLDTDGKLPYSSSESEPSAITGLGSSLSSSESESRTMTPCPVYIGAVIWAGGVDGHSVAASMGLLSRNSSPELLESTGDRGLFLFILDGFWISFAFPFPLLLV